MCFIRRQACFINQPFQMKHCFTIVPQYEASSALLPIWSVPIGSFFEIIYASHHDWLFRFKFSVLRIERTGERHKTAKILRFAFSGEHRVYAWACLWIYITALNILCMIYFFIKNLVFLLKGVYIIKVLFTQNIFLQKTTDNESFVVWIVYFTVYEKSFSFLLSLCSAGFILHAVQ